MIIKMHEIPIREVVEKYKDNAAEGVVGYDNRLNIRPAYQREFVYKDNQRDAVIDTVRKGFPLNIMYWVKNSDDNFEVLDGQQRTISICQYVHGDFSIDFQYFFNLTKAEQNQILDYKLMVYVCEGTDKEKLEWFKVINIAGLRLTEQEMRNAVYSGPWVADAKRYFSKSGCVAQKIGSPYLNGSADRQEYLETAIEWIINSKKDKDIEDYMAIHQGDGDATGLWLHFQTVINWVETYFTKYRREMKGLEWGRLHKEFSAKSYNSKDLEKKVASLMADKGVQNKKGIYEYLLSDGVRAEKLNLRQFDDDEKREAYETQGGICPKCGKHFAIEEMEGDHIVPWSKGGKTVPENLQMLCRRCNGLKSNR